MALDSQGLKWTGQFTVAPPTRTQRLHGDKILLPPYALEQLLAAAPTVAVTRPDQRSLTSQFDPFNPYTFAAERRARELTAENQQQLPNPLMFRIVNPRNGRAVHAGIREFSAQENEVGLSPFLRKSLGFDDSDLGSSTVNMADYSVSDEEIIAESDMVTETKELVEGGQPTVTVHARQLPRGTYVRLRPLAAGYDTEDWKALLERYLRNNFTTLTVQEVLTVTGGRNESFQFLVDKVLPEGDGICVVDTDLEVDIEPLDEEQARETLRQRLEKSAPLPGMEGGSSIGGKISVTQEQTGKVRQGDYVDYELPDWDHTVAVDIEIDAADGSTLDLFANPLSTRQRARPREDEHVFGNFSNNSSKRIRLEPSATGLQDVESLYISVHSYSHDTPEPEQGENEAGTTVSFALRVIPTSSSKQNLASLSEEAGHDANADDIQCKNCLQWIPKRTVFLHENFCFRNNVHCPKCRNVFQKRLEEWENHWHCGLDDAYGNDRASKRRHDYVYHSKHACPNCPFLAPSLPELAQHRTTTCPGKLVLCQFCHLIVPQQGESDPDPLDPEVLYSQLTPHELVEGGRTTECHLCNKIIRLRDMGAHLRYHDLDRRSRRPPRICNNPNCCRTLGNAHSQPNAASMSKNALDLCNVCFGPLYVDVYDPEGKALRRRIERRYLSQMLTGCGKSWCLNEYCKTGRLNLGIGTAGRSVTAKEVLGIVKPLVDSVSVLPGDLNLSPVYFCTDETNQKGRKLADMLATEAISSENEGYDVRWCVAAVESAGGDVVKAREWLNNWAPKKGEASG